jgi:hypothetical protein
MAKVGVEESIVNPHGSTCEPNLTFCLVCVFTLQTDKRLVHIQHQL